MFNKIIDTLIKRKQGLTAVPRKYCNINNAETIVILCAVSLVKNGMLNQIKGTLNGKKILTVIYDKDLPNASIDNNYIVFGKKACSILSKPTFDIVNIIKKTNPDLWINLSLYSISPFKYLLAQSKSGYRCGIKQDGNECVDMKIRIPHSYNEIQFFKTLCDYMDKIK